MAVKKLETIFKVGQKDFKTDVKTIAITHHKNLVQTLGYCDDGVKWLFIYEYMSNGTLAFFLFGGMRPLLETEELYCYRHCKGTHIPA
ncbi:putative protein kinase RLK-Pelle-SD-2b family [Helianthus annuus]|nr:putative protein kinase RLK-Pelle-SD-2b family [Helianthus annuus]